MSEMDDRLAGDPVWELFAVPATRPANDSLRVGKLLPWLILANMSALGGSGLRPWLS